MIWKSQDGRVFERVEDIETSHLRNIIAHIRARGFIEASVWWSMCDYIRTAPDGAALAVEAELQQVLPSWRLDLFVRELEKREPSAPA